MSLVKIREEVPSNLNLIGAQRTLLYCNKTMRLFSTKVPVIASEVAKKLIAEEDLEASSALEVQRDIEAVLNEYLRLEREVLQKTRELMDYRNLPPTEFTRAKKAIAEQKGLKAGDETLDYLLDQLVECFLYSTHVEEVFASDLDMRRKMAPILKKHMAIEEELDREARTRLRHLSEGTPAWEIEYSKAIDLLKRSKGIQ